MNKVLRFRGTEQEGKQMTNETGYVYLTETGMVIFDELKNKKEFVNKENQGGDTADIVAISTRLNILEDKVSSLKKTNTEVVAATGKVEMKDATKDYIVSGTITSAASTTVKSVEMKNVELKLAENATLTSNNALLLDAKEDVEIKASSLEMNNQKSSNLLKVTSAKSIIVKDTEFTGATYNTIMTGQNTKEFVKNMLIDNCYFNEDCKHFNIWFSGWDDNAVLTISNCTFKTAEQFLCLGDFATAGNKLTVNIVNCSIENYDNGYREGYGYDYAGYIILDARNVGDYNSLVSKNPFGNVSINIDNLTVKGKKVTKDNFKVATGAEGQSLYFYHNKTAGTGCIKYSEDTKQLFPVITVK